MTNDSDHPNLREAANRFVATLPYKDKNIGQQAIYGFARWYGWESSFAELTAPSIANYAERLSASDTDYNDKLKLIRAFLTFAKRAGWSKTSLGVHLKAKKIKIMQLKLRGTRKSATLTPEGYAELEAELDSLKEKRHLIIAEIQRAAADKDFRENAPLAAAREQRGHLEGRILELEETLKSATVLQRSNGIVKINVGDVITLRDKSSNEDFEYILVDPREVDPAKGKISSISPIGRAIMGRVVGDVVSVAAPVGTLHYEIRAVKR